MTIEELLEGYGPSTDDGEYSPPAFQSNHQVQAFVHGQPYFIALDREITQLIDSTAAGRYFYLSAWWLGLIDANAEFRLGLKGNRWTEFQTFEPFMLPGRWLLDALKQMAESGVDVRVLAWCDPYIPQVEKIAKQSGLIRPNLHTLLSVQSLRMINELANKVMLNTCGHSLGGAHAKFVVCGDQNNMCTFVSGLDPEAYRISPSWHDVGVRVEGFAAKACYNFYENLWQEQLKRKPLSFSVDGKTIVSHKKNYPEILDHTAPGPHPTNMNRIHVQVLRTLPAMNYTSKGPQQLPESSWVKTLIGKTDKLASLIGLSWRRRPISFAPTGLFEFHKALRKAISQARDYIFIADQAFKSFETMDWINRQLRSEPNLKVILLYGADPADPPNEFILQALNQHLIRGLDDAEIERRIVYCEWRDVVVHCKVTIIDDVWCAVGSTNCFRRSHFTDIELSVGILDPTWVRDFRRQLWAEYVTLRADTLVTAEDVWLFANLRIWHPVWNVTEPRTVNVYRKKTIVRRRLPLKRNLWCMVTTGPPNPNSWDTRRATWIQVTAAKRQSFINELDGYLGGVDSAKNISNTLLNFEGRTHEFHEGSWSYSTKKLKDILDLDKNFTVEVISSHMENPNPAAKIWRLERMIKSFVNIVIYADENTIKIYHYFSDSQSNLWDPDSRQTF